LSNHYTSTKRMQRLILKGPIVKTLFLLGLPLMLTNVFQMCYSLADTYWLGQYVGEVGVAATTLAWPLVFFFVSFAGGMAVAGTSLVSQYTGMKNKREVKRSAGQVLVIMSLIAISVSILGILLADLVLDFMGAQPEVFENSSVYIKIIFISMPFMFVIQSFAAVMRGWGDTKTPMLISAVSVVINLILDPFLIIGIGPFPELGVAGAAIATVISRAVGAAICIYVLFWGRQSLRIAFKHLKLQKEKVKQILRVGLPASAGQSMVALGFVFIMSFVAYYGTDVLAAHGVGTRVINIVFIITMGLAMASTAMIGQNLGANKIKRAERILNRTILVAAVFLIACSTFFYIFNEQLYSIFIPDRDVIAYSNTFMITFGISIIGFGIFNSVQAAYRASGRTIPSMIMGLIRLWGLRVPLAYLFGFVLGWGIGGIWLGLGVSNFASAVIALAWAATGSWKSGVVEKKVPDIREPLA